MRNAKEMTTKDYAYCEDCEMFVDLFKYDDINAAGHGGHRWRYATDEELPGLVSGCSESVPYCVECGCIVEFELSHGQEHCDYCGNLLRGEGVYYEDCFGRVTMSEVV